MTSSTPQAWQVAPDRIISLDQPRIMGILNVTPDSFSDGGAYANGQQAVDAAIQMTNEGACIIDVGGESTRPGSQPVTEQEQIHRVVPVIAALREQLTSNDFFISIDTTSATVAQAALDVGASIINDTSAGRDDPSMLPLAASRACGIILMHRLKRPHLDSYSTSYASPPDYGHDVVHFVKQFLFERTEAAIESGLSRNSIVVDPGLGFGKTVAQNLALAGRISEFAELAFPVLSAASRKSFVGAVSGEALPAQRILGSVAVSVAHWIAGVRLYRVHDVAAHAKALRTANALTNAAAGRAN